MADHTDGAATDPRFRTTSPERAIHLCSTAFYPHRLPLLGRSNGFGLSQRVTRVGVSRWATSPTTQTLPCVSMSLAAPATSLSRLTAGSSRGTAGSKLTSGSAEEAGGDR